MRLDVGYQIVGEADERQAAAQLGLETQPEIWILDARFPGLNSVDILRRIGKREILQLVAESHSTRGISWASSTSTRSRASPATRWRSDSSSPGKLTDNLR